MKNHEKFLQAIQEKKIILIKKHTEEKGVIERKCIPYDYAIGKRFKDNIKRYWTWHIETKHPSPAKNEDIISIEILNEHFDPADYIRLLSSRLSSDNLLTCSSTAKSRVSKLKKY